MTGSGRHVAIAAARSSTFSGTRLTRAGSVGLSLPRPGFTVSTAHRGEVDDPDPDRFAMHLTNSGTQYGRWPSTYGRRTDGLCDFPVSHVYCRWCRRPSWIICLRRRAGPVTMRMKSSSGKVGSCGSEWSVCVGCCVSLGPHWRVAVPPTVCAWGTVHVTIGIHNSGHGTPRPAKLSPHRSPSLSMTDVNNKHLYLTQTPNVRAAWCPSFCSVDRSIDPSVSRRGRGQLLVRIR